MTPPRVPTQLAGNQLDQAAQDLILEFTLSAQFARDNYLERAERRQHRSR